MDVSSFEYRLLRYFHEVYLVPGEMKQPPLHNLWQVQVPQLFHVSPLLRSSIFSLSSLYLWNLCDLSSWIYDSNENSELKYMTLCNMQDLHDIPNVSEFLQEKTNEYYSIMLRDMSQLMSVLASPERQVNSVDEAAEIAISGILLFSFLALQTTQLIPLMSEDLSQPDLLSMCRGMRVSMGKAWPLLYHSRFSGLFYKNEVLTPPTVTELYPLVNHLRCELDNQHDLALVTTSQYEDFVHALDTLDIVIKSSVDQNFPLPLYKWIFLVKEEIYDYMRRDRLHYSLQLMFVVCCLNIITTFYLKRYSNMWIDYIHWYKEYCFVTFGSWDNDFDRRIYDLVHSKYAIPDNEYHLLASFSP